MRNFFRYLLLTVSTFFPTTRPDIQIYFSVFLRISLQLYRFILASYDRFPKINIFGLFTPRTKTHVELANSILAINSTTSRCERPWQLPDQLQSLNVYKECNTTSSLSNQFLTGSGTSSIRLVAVSAKVTTLSLTRVTSVSELFSNFSRRVNDRLRIPARCVC